MKKKLFVIVVLLGMSCILTGCFNAKKGYNYYKAGDYANAEPYFDKMTTNDYDLHTYLERDYYFFCKGMTKQKLGKETEAFHCFVYLWMEFVDDAYYHGHRADDFFQKFPKSFDYLEKYCIPYQKTVNQELAKIRDSGFISSTQFRQLSELTPVKKSAFSKPYSSDEFWDIFH